MLYTGPLQDYNILLKWATDKCVPLVREITFENAEASTRLMYRIFNVSWWRKNETCLLGDDKGVMYTGPDSEDPCHKGSTSLAYF